MVWIIDSWCYTAALLAKYKGPEMEKPVIRPYTPVSDEGELPSMTLTQLHSLQI